ncbi:MAG TPA: catalase [Thermoanaerobaculia bacterium]
MKTGKSGDKGSNGDGNKRTESKGATDSQPSSHPASQPAEHDAANGRSTSADRPSDPKTADLGVYREDGSGETLTTNQGVPINDNQNQLKAGERGPSLLEDFIFREKMTHFDHERIPERIVHPRGSGAHGYFQPYENAKKYSKAAFLQNPAVRTPLFVRFSTVVGFRGSTDLARDVRGFAVKLYTEEGNFDLVGNNMPVFFIQDAMKFPDLVHAIKPEPDSEMPQASAAHDTFWDFISLMPESMHVIMWAMSDRAIPRSYRMMEGFGVHTFRLIDAEGVSRFIKWHWKPLLGTHSVTWDEAQKISGTDPDFHRRDLWEAIEQGHFPEWELGIQVIEESREHEFDFDLLDATKLVPEELVPVERIGKMTLNRNPDNFFAETEQVAFHPGHIVPGIDFSNDPLLQGRLFSYLDTQLKRLGGPNFHEIPINRPIAPVHNNQRDGHMRQTINKGKVAYEPNTIGGGCPMQASSLDGGFVSFAEKLQGLKVRARGEKFFDHFSQATMFVNSQSPAEKDHMVEALRFELGKVERIPIRERMLALLDRVDRELAMRVAEGLGYDSIPEIEKPVNRSIPADGNAEDFEPRKLAKEIGSSPALSMENTPKDSIVTRKVALLAADGVNVGSVKRVKKALEDAGAMVKVVAPRLGTLKGDGGKLDIDHSFLTTSSVLFDALYIPGGAKSIETLAGERDAIAFVTEAFRHCKPIAADGEGVELLRECPGLFGSGGETPEGVVTIENAADDAFARKFIDAIRQHRFWNRPRKNRVSMTPSDDTRGRVVSVAEKG